MNWPRQFRPRKYSSEAAASTVWTLCQVLLFIRRQLDAQPFNDVLHDRVLHGDDVAGVSIDAIAPDYLAGSNVEQLHGHPQVVARRAGSWQSELRPHPARVPLRRAQIVCPDTSRSLTRGELSSDRTRANSVITASARENS